MQIQRVFQALVNFLRVAIGSGENESYPLDLNELAYRYDLKKMPTYYAIKKMENQGVLNLSQAFSNKSKVFFEITQSELYDFQVSNKDDLSAFFSLHHKHPGTALVKFDVRSSQHEKSFFSSLNKAKIILSNRYII